MSRLARSTIATCRGRVVLVLLSAVLLSSCGAFEVGPPEVDVEGALAHEGDDELAVRGTLYRQAQERHAMLCQSAAADSGDPCGAPALRVVGLENVPGVRKEIVRPPRTAEPDAHWIQQDVTLEGSIDDGVLTVPVSFPSF